MERAGVRYSLETIPTRDGVEGWPGGDVPQSQTHDCKTRRAVSHSPSIGSQALQCIIPGPHLVVDARAAALVVILYNHLLQRRACASERQRATRLGFPPRTLQFQTTEDTQHV